VLFRLGYYYLVVHYCTSFTGTTNYQQLFQIFATIDKSVDIEVSNAIILGVLFILVGMLFKLSAAPFHLWAPDVYEGAPTSVTAFFAIVPKIVNFEFNGQIIFLCFLWFVIILGKKY